MGKKVLSAAALRQRQQAGLRHGARSQAVSRHRSRYVKQSVLQPLGIRYADLDQIARRQLDLYSRIIVKVECYDAWAQEHGFLQEDGSTPPWVREYYAAVNAASRILSKLEEGLRRHQLRGPTPLERHLAEHYADVEDAEYEEVNGDGG